MIYLGYLVKLVRSNSKVNCVLCLKAIERYFDNLYKVQFLINIINFAKIFEQQNSADMEKFGRIKLSNNYFRRNVADVEGGIELLSFGVAGFQLSNVKGTAFFESKLVARNLSISANEKERALSALISFLKGTIAVIEGS